jgi:excisionase family DNA binding protein
MATFPSSKPIPRSPWCYRIFRHHPTRRRRRQVERRRDLQAAGDSVTVLARDEDLTSQQAADLLNVSRQYMVRLLERGDNPSTKVGTHRRVRAYDLAADRRCRDEQRDVSLADMADQAQALGGYDQPATFGPPRRG